MFITSTGKAVEMIRMDRINDDDDDDDDAGHYRGCFA